MIAQFATYAVRTVQEPRAVATEIAAMRLPMQTLWMLLLLAIVLNTLAYQATLFIVPPPGPIPALFSSPVLFAALVGGGLIASIFALTYVGRSLGGRGDLRTIMSLLIWLQYLRFAVQLLAVVLMPIAPALVSLVVFAASLYGIWLLLNFVDVGHGLNNLMTSFGVLVFAFLAVMFALAFLVSLIGLNTLGILPNV